MALDALLEPICREGIEAELVTTGDLAISLPRMALIHRMAQEALRNVVKHSHAQHAQVRVERSNGTALLRVTDDGTGFSTDDLKRRRSEGHVGLGLLAGTVRDAGATLHVNSVPGSGTTVRLEVPCGIGAEGSDSP